ncbi:MAG: Tex-like protein [Bacillales bacterium]|jgi:uncharacterized protein|nr:Tex-like protein [Bacillales bacterium]
MESNLKRIDILAVIQSDFKFRKEQIKSVIELSEDGCTIPFIARYRKEKTGGLDEVQIKDVLERYQYLTNLENRKDEVLRLIEEKGKLTEELQNQILKSTKLQEVEDLYRPYKEKRRTKATIAREKGLEPLALWMLNFGKTPKLTEYASTFLNEDHELLVVEDVIAGAKDIISEIISDDAKVRDWIRNLTWRKGEIESSVKDEKSDEKGVFTMYYEYQEPLSKVAAHRILAMNRGEDEEVLKISINVASDEVLSYISRIYLKEGQAEVVKEVRDAIEEAYKKYIQPAIEREVRKDLTEKGEEQAIHIFAENLKNLLLQPPLKGKMVLGLDPAYRTGCKLGIVDDTGKMIKIDVVYPHKPQGKWDEAKSKIISYLNKYKIELIAIGNGTASRESEQLISEVVKEHGGGLAYIIVNEAGASVYSASELAREEFPDLQVEERSAISIARRLQDPLAELVKIDPKSVGVGQYQHDVSQKRLQESLQFTVETVVNKVGVNVNTASISLLQYVSGLSKSVAKNIVKLRDEKGRFVSRDELKSVPRLGAKTYEQCIGFLRIIDGGNKLDSTPIHPENYSEVKKLLKSYGFTHEDLGKEEVKQVLSKIDLEEASKKTGIGILTLQDIIEALEKPGRDPREELQAPLLRQDVLKMEDLKKGMELEGTVRNVVDFGVFIDIGVKQDGMVHKSKLSNKFIKHPMDIVSVGQIVKVWVEEVDLVRQRIALTMVQSN